MEIQLKSKNRIMCISCEDDGSTKLVAIGEPSGKHEKMSKSSGNGVTVDEVTNAVFAVSPGFKFVTLPPFFSDVDHKSITVYRNSDGMYYTTGAFGEIPVLLADTSQEYIPRFVINGEVRVQHEDKIPVGYLED